jgi:secreted PhoX family phosphatase
MNNPDDDNVCNTSGNQSLQDVVDARVTRRGFLKSGLTAAALSLVGVDALLKAVPASAKANGGPLLGFQAIPVSTADEVVVPPGYTARVLIAWGDPVSTGPALKQDASNSAADQALQWGAHNDGVVYFPINGSARGLLVQNNEYADEGLLFTDGIANWNAEKTNKSINAHGVSIIEISKQGGKGELCGRHSTHAALPVRLRSRWAARPREMIG